MEKVRLTRKKYQEIRKYDHNQMNEYIQSIYEEGFRCGQKNIPDNVKLDLGELEERLQNIRGIGGAKARAVATEVLSLVGEK